MSKNEPPRRGRLGPDPGVNTSNGPVESKTIAQFEQEKSSPFDHHHEELLGDALDFQVLKEKQREREEEGDFHQVGQQSTKATGGGQVFQQRRMLSEQQREEEHKFVRQDFDPYSIYGEDEDEEEDVWYSEERLFEVSSLYLS